MTRARGRPARGSGLNKEAIVCAALELLAEAGVAGLTMRGLASRLGVTPMSLYHHVSDRNTLLRAMADQVYAPVMASGATDESPRLSVKRLLTDYHAVVGRHAALVLALVATPQAVAGAARQMTAQLERHLACLTREPELWRDILVDHAHGSGLALAGVTCSAEHRQLVCDSYARALEHLLDALACADEATLPPCCPLRQGSSA